MNTNSPLDRLDIERVFPGPPEQLWQAWTTEEGLARWWWHTWPDTRYEVIGGIGGGYRIDAGAHGIGVRGEYLEWEPPARLVFTWIWQTDGSDGDVERVEVTFTPTADGTRLALSHTGPWTEEASAANYRQGWDFVLDALGRPRT